jgi:hypothetical protein
MTAVKHRAARLIHAAFASAAILAALAPALASLPILHDVPLTAARKDVPISPFEGSPG